MEQSRDLITLSIKQLNFRKIVTKNKQLTNYTISDLYGKRKTIKLFDVNIPFGIEKYLGKSILNIELNPSNNNLHYNYNSIITEFENEFCDVNNFKPNITENIKNKGYHKNIKDSKIGRIIRTHVLPSINVFTIDNNKKHRVILSDIKMKTANIELELHSMWENDNNYGIMWYVKTIEIL